ncbi:hypothetical protein APHAL10511_004782 [Amanita phalloides]|nr:hypothetical protein APHAL10511_004782 [Amanita phalloides]
MSSLNQAAGDVFNDNARTLAPAAVGFQVLLMSVVSVVTIVVFNVLRPKNKIIYEPKVKYHVGHKPPPRASDSVFGWLPPLIHTTEPELLDKVGLDAVTFLRFLRLLRWLFTGIALLTCSILIPIDVTYNLRHTTSGGSRHDILSIMTIRDVGGAWLYAHVVVTYLTSFLIVYCVDVHWRQMIKLRRSWFRSPEYLQSFYARTLAVLHVPKKNQGDEGLRAIFESVKVPYPTTNVHIGRKVGRLPELIEYHNETVRQFEQVLVRYLKGGKLGKNRPMIRVGGFMGCGGVKMDAIDFYTNKLKRTDAAIEEYRAQFDTRKAENYGFASMAAVPYAHVVAKLLSGKHPKGTTIQLAPNPKDIIWENMNKSDIEIARKRMVGFWWLALVCFFNTVPLFVISVLANLSSLTVYVPFLDEWSVASPVTFAIISGVLPPAVSGLFGFFLPIVMRWLTKYMGATTHSRLDRAVVARYYAFLIISQLMIFTLIGVLFNSVKEIVEQIGRRTSLSEILNNLHTLPAKINSTYINQSSYWLTFFPLRGFLAVFDLAQIMNLVWTSFKTHVLGRTPRDIREWTQPPEFQYAIYYSNLLFMAAVGLVFAPLAPLVAVAAAVVFWISSWVYKYQLMFVFVSKVESGGRIWNVVINRLLFSVLLMQALMILTIGLQYKFSSLQWLSTIPPILIVFAYKIYINKVYLSAFRWFIPSEEELRLAHVHSALADSRSHRLERRFNHPALHAELFTPMLHATMMPLLSQVYSGKIGRDQAKLNEYGGQKMEAQVIPGGIRIAGINQSDLEYDSTLYQRDRGELDWDQRSMASTALFDSPAASKTGFYANDNASVPSMQVQGYNRYLANGPKQSDVELSPIQEPLGYYHPSMSQQSLLPALSNNPADMTREAPLHRPQARISSYSEDQLMSRTPRPESLYHQYPPQYPPQHLPSHTPSPSQRFSQFQYPPQHTPSHSPSPSQQFSQFQYPPSRPHTPGGSTGSHTPSPSMQVQPQYSSHPPSPSMHAGSPNLGGRAAHKTYQR